MERLNHLLEKGADEKLFEKAYFCISDPEGTIVDCSAGGCGPASLFDVASITKVFTALVIRRLMSEGALSPHMCLGDFPFLNVPGDREGITLYDLLSHTSGLPPYVPFYEKFIDNSGKLDLPGRDVATGRIVEMIMGLPLESHRGERIAYSDVGFILLGHIMETVSDKPLSQLLHEYVTGPMKLRDTLYNPLETLPHCDDGRIVSTGYCRVRGREKVGEVDDLNCFALGGVSGHAGLFSTGHDLTILAREILTAPSGKGSLLTEGEAIFLLQEVVDRDDKRRRAGFDVPSGEGSLSGSRFSPDSAGHLGYTGVSLWIDFREKRGMVLLTNSQYFNGDRDSFDSLRRNIHDTAWEVCL